MPAWRPTPFLIFSSALHVGALALVLVRAELWPLALGAVLLNRVRIGTGSVVAAGAVIDDGALWTMDFLVEGTIGTLPAAK